MFYNSGTIRVGLDSAFVANGTYTQRGGRTELDGGSLSAPLVDNEGGVIDGGGLIVANVRNAGQVYVGGQGLAGVLFVIGNYTQTLAGTLHIDIGGRTFGSDYDLLYVSETAALGGTLDIHLINAFLPKPDDLLLILLCSARVGDFATINGLLFSENRAFLPFPFDNGYLLWTYRR